MQHRVTNVGLMRKALELFLLIALALAAACSRPPPEERLREALSVLQASLEARDAGAMREWLSDDFVGPDGLDRDGAGRLARVMFLRHRDVGVSMGPVEMDVTDGHATARFSAVLTGGSGRLIPETARVYEVETGWREEAGEWRLTSVRW